MHTVTRFPFSAPRAVVERLHDLVLHDLRLTTLGIRGLARVAFQEVTGQEPTTEEVRAVALAFWQYWHEQYDKPIRRFVVREGPRRPVEDMSPGQENAIRAWEDE